MYFKYLAVVDDDIFLEALPSAKMYEKSFMHREQISHVFASKYSFMIHITLKIS